MDSTRCRREREPRHKYGMAMSAHCLHSDLVVPSMANPYSTKSLGRVWAPSSPSSPSPRVASKGRFNSESTSFPTTALRDLRLFRGRPAERLGLAICLLTLIVLLACHAPTLHLPNTSGFGKIFSHLRLGGSVIPAWHRAPWNQFAYVTYATALDHLCNSVMLAESLHRVHAKPRTLILYSSAILSPTACTTPADSDLSILRLLQQAESLYGADTQQVHVLTSPAATDPTWSQGFTKYLAFNQTQYRRVLALDSDATILQPLDDLFLLPPTPLAMTRAYWLNDTLGAELALITPDAQAYKAIESRVAKAGSQEFDMEILNAVYGDTCMVVPHRPYVMLSGELRSQNHRNYLSNEWEEWDAARAILEVRYVHFSDWPVPKPWLPRSEGLVREQEPKCRKKAVAVNEEGKLVEEEECTERLVWRNLYEGFRERRKVRASPRPMFKSRT